MNFLRRRLLLMAGASLAAPRAMAQRSARSVRVGVLTPFSAMGGEHYMRALRERLVAHGYVEGRNLTLVPRDIAWSRIVAKERALELVKSKVDAIFTLTTIATLGAQDATKSTPIVFSWVADPVFSGIVKDYRRPGGNTTGVSNRFFELVIKRLELVRELAPDATRVVVLAGTFDSTLQTAMRLAKPAAVQLGLKVDRKEAGVDWTGALGDAAASAANVAMVVTPFTLFGMRAAAEETARAANDLRLPVVYSDVGTVELGGLISYATNDIEDVRRGADHLARVLKGATPATLAVDQASRFELAVNLKAAKAIGIAIPQSILLRADRVIE